MNKFSYDRIYTAAWWFCVVTLPWTIPLNSGAIILLGLVWLTEGAPAEQWHRLKNATWIVPFILFFAMHVIGLLYSQDYKIGSFELEKKLSFLVIPIIAASGRTLPKSSIDLLKKGFVHSCLTIVLVSILLSLNTVLSHPDSLPQNFDPQTSQLFHQLNPDASPWWEYFSYIQVGEWIDIHPAYFSMYLVFCIIIVVQDMLKVMKINYWGCAVIAILLFFITLLSSRIAILSLPIVMLYLLYHYSGYPYRRYIAMTGIFIALLVVLVWLNPVSRFRILQEPILTSLHIDQSKTEWNSVSLRLLEWKGSLHVLSESWLLGSGSGDAQAELQKYYVNFNESTAGLTYNAHNQYLQTAMELGLVGFVLLMICFIPSMVSALQQNPVQVAFILLFCLMCLTESILARQKGIVFFTLFQSIFMRSAVNP